MLCVERRLLIPTWASFTVCLDLAAGFLPLPALSTSTLSLQLPPCPPASFCVLVPFAPAIIRLYCGVHSEMMRQKYMVSTADTEVGNIE
jgi:hypothetical protein